MVFIDLIKILVLPLIDIKLVSICLPFDISNVNSHNITHGVL